MPNTTDIETFVRQMDGARDIVTRMIGDYAQTLLDAQKTIAKLNARLDACERMAVEKGKTIEHLSSQLRLANGARYSGNVEQAVGLVGAQGAPPDNVLRLRDTPPSPTPQELKKMQDARSDL
jgi:hypothetical protein